MEQLQSLESERPEEDALEKAADGGKWSISSNRIEVSVRDQNCFVKILLLKKKWTCFYVHCAQEKKKRKQS